ncbi:hypothetical protein GUJ93_ZPchr0015g6924 [Zizania palustris]|uniref:Uncharacterized protein n=1 Tax=Zizania palustris TaxID=103762 RepID=A0A8J5W703_ZIZPA|nr:hypothetical protein GUJ93_ZPchr0015g6924 [Zizania palustris]
MDAPQSTRGEKERVQPIHSDVLASLRTAAEGLNATVVDDGLHAEVADGLLAAATVPCLRHGTVCMAKLHLGSVLLA